MNERIQKLTELTLSGQLFSNNTEVHFDRNDLFLSKPRRTAKRLHDFLMVQVPRLTEYQSIPSVVDLNHIEIGGPYHYHTFENISELLRDFYQKPVDDLVTFEWQHATADYRKAIQLGLNGFLELIGESKAKHASDAEKLEFLECLESAAHTLIDWAHKVSEEALRKSELTKDLEHRENLYKLHKTLKKVPEYPAESFYEAVVSTVMLFNYARDSLGTLDRTLYPYYKKDIENGALTPEEAKLLLQELFLVLQASIPNGCNFTRGAESHFCVGGYDETGDDVFNELSMLILEALTALPIYIPQVSLRRTKKLPHDTFLKVLELCVRDDNKRIAFISDDAKIKAFIDIAQIPYEVACKYTSVGCNEVAFPGGFVAGTTNANLLRSLQSTLYDHENELLEADTWEKFWELYKAELLADIDRMLAYEDAFMRVRSRDTSYTTSLLFTDCIDKADSFTRGACTYAIAGPSVMGVTNLIDSLTVIKQFVYDQKLVSMKTLLEALKNNWQGYEVLRAQILKKAEFFGNDCEISNFIAKLLTDTLYEYTKDTTSLHGYHLLFGNLQGYCPHHKWFGAATKATPDGRKEGDMLKFGLGQNAGYDREGLAALLNSIAACDTHGILSGGSSVTNVNLDAKLVETPESLEKTARLFETYFDRGGSQFQLNFVSAEDLKKAKITPTEYKSLRVRVSGFSDYFVNLPDSIQDDVIERTVKK